MLYTMADSEFTGEGWFNSTSASEHFVIIFRHQYSRSGTSLEHLMQNIPLCFLNTHRTGTSANYLIHKDTAETSANYTNYKVGEVRLDGLRIPNTHNDR
jgi:hypothetical protein